MEVAHSPSRVHVRDSKNLQGPTHQHGSGRVELLRAVRRTELVHSGGAADGITLRHRSHWYCAPIATATMSHIQMTCTASTGLRDVDYCPLPLPTGESRRRRGSRPRPGARHERTPLPRAALRPGQASR
ncbi:hypothetical protein [Streptomyces lunaelactis]|uniref:hypothetical protein n=1 Tax=Streptomyces lunaelactis TaxID=1535768 RepID=UPI00359F5714